MHDTIMSSHSALVGANVLELSLANSLDMLKAGHWQIGAAVNDVVSNARRLLCKEGFWM